jgi:cyclic-di-AMP phosphodiesterase PgpH
MVERFEALLQQNLQISAARTRRILHFTGVSVAAAAFVLVTTMLVAYDTIFLGVNDVSELKIGDIAAQDIHAPINVPSYISPVLTEQRRQQARDSVAEVYFQPDPAVIRQQSDLAQEILDYINNIRHDPYGTLEQKHSDLHKISDLAIDDNIVAQILIMDEKNWTAVSDQITSVLERVMRGEIRESNVASVIAQLPMQVSVRFNEDQANVIVAILQNLVRPNTLLDEASTQALRDAAAANVAVPRSFERGQIIVRAGEKIDDSAYEALQKLGLLDPSNQRFREIGRAGLAGTLILIIVGLYISRFRPSLFQSSRFMALLAAIFLIILVGARITGSDGQIYLYPTSALALLYVALVGPEIAIIGVLSLAILVGIMQDNSLELMLLVAVSGIMASLTLRRAERLNGYFRPGLVVGLTNVAVVAIFYEGSNPLSLDGGLAELILYSFINGMLAAAVALGGLYIVTLVFNLPTGLKLSELSQPSQPLLQRLLREAPGTYQHSLQVANLAEQAANAIGVNADLVRVAALYHDVGKMINPAFFTENQVEGINPHDALNDPFRSAEIIISHVTDGEKIARQYRLPARLRDFIMEHHGTTQASYFYQQALERAGDDKEVDLEQFTYPGPKPQTRETAILMLADSCEATVRSRKPTKKQEIVDTIQQVIDDKMRMGQLDESNLTLNDIRIIRKIFADMLQAVFHPRISYPPNLKVPRENAPESSRTPVRTDSAAPDVVRTVRDTDRTPPVVTPVESSPSDIPTTPRPPTKEVPVAKNIPEEDNKPLSEVPPLPRAGDHKTARSGENGSQPMKKDVSEEQ